MSLIKLKTLLYSKYLYILLTGLVIIYSIIFLNIPRKSVLDSNTNYFIGYIRKIDISGNKLSLEVFNKEKVIGTYYFKDKVSRDNFNKIYQLGDKIKITGTFSIPTNNTLPNLFNYKKYLNRKGIYYLFKIDNIKLLDENSNMFYKVKNSIIKHIDSYKSREYLNTFILGSTGSIDNNIKTTYQTNGVGHLLAVSGMHVSLLSGMILWVFKKLKFPNIISFLFISLFLLFYMLLLGATSSVSRAVVLFIILGLNRSFKLNIKTIYICLLTFDILVLINPNSLFDVGFQFSCIVSFYLILGRDLLKAKSYYIKLLKVSILTFIVSIPISLYYFYQINLLSVIYNLLFVPLVTLIVFPLAIITYIIPILDPIFLFTTSIMENMSIFVDNIVFSKLIFMKPSIIWIIIYYLVFTLYIYKRKKIIVFFLVGLISFQYFNLLIFPKTYFIMLDIGQGDSLLIHSNNETILIDTGGKISIAKEEWETGDSKPLSDNTVIPLLKVLGIRRLNHLIITHGDYDHMGEVINLVNNFKVENVIFNCGPYNDLEKELINVLEKKNIKYYPCIKELNIDKYKLQFLNTKEYDNENDNSSVIYFNYNNYKFLFMGDAGIEKEKDILEKYNLKYIDFIKIGHHGSNTSSSELFINSINPKYSLISVGKNNRYGHPKDEVLDTLSNSKIYRTDSDGSIEIKLNKNGYKIRMCSP